MKSITVAIALFLVYLSFCSEDYYRLLGVKRDATTAEIKKAFKKLSLKYHPDKNKDNSERAKSMFIKIANAYEILSNDKYRQIYDQDGEEAVKEAIQMENSGQGGGFGGFGGYTMDGSFEDLFSSFFGGGGGSFNFQEGGQSGGFQVEEEEEEEEDKKIFENTDVINLKMNNLSQFYARNEIWFILFYKPRDKDIQALKEMMKLLAEKSYGIFKIGVINCNSDEEICDESDIHETPLIVYFPETSESEEVYRGRKTWEEIFNYGAKRMQSFVRVINKDNYGDFITSNPNQYKVVLFTARKSTPPLLKALSKHFLGKLSFGEIRQTESELVQRFKVNQFPTLMVISDPEQYQGVSSEGPFNRDNLQKFLRQYAYGPKKPEKTASVKELTLDIYQKQKICNDSDQKNICVVYIAHQDQLLGNENELLESLANKYKKDPIMIFYLNPSKYKFFWVSFDENDKDSSLIVLKGKRKRYAPIKSGMNLNDITNAIDEIISGGWIFKQMIKKLNLQTGINELEDL